jgi:hypothetical protein
VATHCAPCNRGIALRSRRDRPARRLKLSEQEQQLIEVIRENAADDGFRLLLERQSGVWEVMLKVPIKGRKKAAPRVG